MGTVPVLSDAATREHSPQYTAYIASPEWGAFRAAYIARHGALVCTACGSPRRVQLHHRHYRTLGHESPDDVTPLCKSCHENVHNAARQGGTVLAAATDRYIRRFLRARAERIVLPPAGRAEMRPRRAARTKERPPRTGRPARVSAADALRRNARALGVGW